MCWNPVQDLTFCRHWSFACAFPLLNSSHIKTCSSYQILTFHFRSLSIISPQQTMEEHTILWHLVSSLRVAQNFYYYKGHFFTLIHCFFFWARVKFRRKYYRFLNFKKCVDGNTMHTEIHKRNKTLNGLYYATMYNLKVYQYI